ncbi:MAG: hypothetical protein DRR06_06760 [Gammaproteobacteria bacterium]|nr:MAG: hypothetical protein DRR06_06760 [Gammaproteobacteria bacterium]RLA51526.1 MAG: hypothetical protein DRR42_10085 [Gammaproteobacteria bacterium]
MAKETIVEQKSKAAISTGLPGIQMHKARMDQTISIEDAASAMGLTVRSLQALEADDYDKLPSEVYIRGYIRRYCSLLNIEPATILEEFEANIESEKDPAGEDSRIQFLESKKIRMAIICTAGVVLLLLAIVALGDDPHGGFAQYNTISVGLKYVPMLLTLVVLIAP